MRLLPQFVGTFSLILLSIFIGMRVQHGRCGRHPWLSISEPQITFGVAFSYHLVLHRLVHLTHVLNIAFILIAFSLGSNRLQVGGRYLHLHSIISYFADLIQFIAYVADMILVNEADLLRLIRANERLRSGRACLMA